MKNIKRKVVVATIIGLLFPFLSEAQTFTGEIQSMQSVLDDLYDEMIPLCYELIGIGQGIGGFAALWYIGSRVWRNIANAEPIDFYPLLRPFAIGMAIMLFPSVLDVLNGVMQPTVSGTANLVSDTNNSIQYLLQQKEAAIQKTPMWKLFGDEGTHGKWYKYENPEGGDEDPDLLSNGIKFMMAKATYGLKNVIKQWLQEILDIIYQAAALCINTIRTFYLIVLAILGPLVFALSIFDGLQNTLTVWLARYINVFLWLPVANIFGSIIAKIQENMLKQDLRQLEAYGDTFFSSADTMYIIFMIIGIVGYFTVPSVANYIVHAGGANTLLYKTTNLLVSAGGKTASVLSSTAGTIADSFKGNSSHSGNSSSNSSDKTNHAGSSNGFMHDRLSGNKS